MTQMIYLTDMHGMNSTAGTQQVQLQVGPPLNAHTGQVSTKISGQQPTNRAALSAAHSAGGQTFTIVTGDRNGIEHEGVVQIQQQHQQGANEVVYQQQQSSYVDYNQTAQPMYSAVSSGYYESSGAQIMTQGSDAYFIQGTYVDGESQALAHTIRASPQTVQWLVDNYETAEGVSMPRSTMYFHYLRHCEEQQLEPMNPASFGKLIRSIFMRLKTRRLGTRGNSQYHYYGIRIKSLSALNHFIVEPPRKIFKTDHAQHTPQQDASSYSTAGTGSSSSHQPSSSSTANSQQQQQFQQYQQYLDDTAMVVPDFGHVDIDSENLLNAGLRISDIEAFLLLHREHCEAFIEIVYNLQFPLVETLWMSFWRTSQDDPVSFEMEQRLSKDKLYSVCGLPAVREYMRRSDNMFYQALVRILMPDVLRPIPSALTQMIRNFGKNLEGWLKTAITGVPEGMITVKLGAVSAFAQILRRYTSLNHLAQAARAVLQNSTQIAQMLTDINKVDFTNVQEQASWVCQCDDEVVHQLEQDFKRTLQQETSLEQWAVWLERVVNQSLSAHESSSHFPKAARQFLLKWSFYSSMVIRDLTLRSAASFGSFHLIRLLYDEYMFYLVEHKVAAATGETSIALMCELRQAMFGDIAASSLDAEIDAGRGESFHSEVDRSANMAHSQSPNSAKSLSAGTVTNKADRAVPMPTIVVVEPTTQIRAFNPTTNVSAGVAQSAVTPFYSTSASTTSSSIPSCFTIPGQRSIIPPPTTNCQSTYNHTTGVRPTVTTIDQTVAAGIRPVVANLHPTVSTIRPTVAANNTSPVVISTRPVVTSVRPITTIHPTATAIRPISNVTGPVVGQSPQRFSLISHRPPMPVTPTRTIVIMPASSSSTIASSKFLSSSLNAASGSSGVASGGLVITSMSSVSASSASSVSLSDSGCSVVSSSAVGSSNSTVGIDAQPQPISLVKADCP